MSGCRSFGGCGVNVASLVRELLWDNAASQLVQRPVAVRETWHFLRYHCFSLPKVKKRSLYQDRLGTNIGNVEKKQKPFYAQEYALLHNETLVDAEIAHLPAQGGQKTLAVPAGTGASMDLAVSFPY
jgi:hypothetical protein